ncbi:hypothetical protein LCGC14_0095600 [marine sediment metagenome]|uniref:Uncharacterized protein n=1 Tax=marine sediment metagenome TaxID=412755 RepID=A0A0F9XW66_9ZZZZ|nr:hypothetical protein [Phycisphaerae bacterium]HDZ44160.1 hypothetical protein [Phycisphaerae bacterium]
MLGKNVWVVLISMGLILALVGFVADGPRAHGQEDPPAGEEGEDGERTKDRWVLPSYVDPHPWLQYVRVSPNGKQVFYNQIRRLEGHEADQSWYSSRWCTYVLDTTSGMTDDAANTIDRKLTAHFDVYSIEYSPDNKLQLISLLRRTYPVRALFIVRNVKTGKIIAKIPQPERAWACWLGNKRLAVSRQIDKKFGFVYMYSPKGKKLGRTKFRGRVLAADAAGKILVMMAHKADMTRGVTHAKADVVVLRASDGKVLRSVRNARRQKPVTAAISPSAKYVAIGQMCWDYNTVGTDHILNVMPVDPESEVKPLRISRRAPIMPISISDEGNTIILAENPGGRTFGSVKYMNIEGKSRVIVPYNASGAQVHGDEVFCLVDADVPFIVATPLETEGDLTGDETKTP